MTESRLSSRHLCRMTMDEGMSPGSSPSARHIAIVEDDDSLRRATARLLTAYGFQISTYASARAFLPSLEISQPDCLILDLQMSDMTGLELLHYLAGTKFRIPTIIVTAHDEPGTRHRCELAGAFGFLAKPLSLDVLLETIHAALAKASVEQTAGTGVP